MKNNFKHINYSVYLNSANLADEKVRRECCIAIFGAVDLSISSTVNKQILTPVAVCTSSVTHALNKKYTKIMLYIISIYLPIRHIPALNEKK